MLKELLDLEELNKTPLSQEAKGFLKSGKADYFFGLPGTGNRGGDVGEASPGC
jgi:hypothetical protein